MSNVGVTERGKIVKKVRAAFVIVLAALLSACQPTIDFSTYNSSTSSIAEMMTDIESHSEKKAFTQAVKTSMTYISIKHYPDIRDLSRDEQMEFMRVEYERVLDGMTVQDVLDYADSVGNKISERTKQRLNDSIDKALSEDEN